MNDKLLKLYFEATELPAKALDRLRRRPESGQALVAYLGAIFVVVAIVVAVVAIINKGGNNDIAHKIVQAIQKAITNVTKLKVGG